MCVCVCRLPRAFVESPQVGITKFDDIRQERAVFQPSTHLDKVIVAQCATFAGSAWHQLAHVPVRDVLMMIDNFPSHYRQPYPLQAFSVPPPRGFADFFTSPPPAPTPQYSPESPDASGYSPGGYSPRFSPGMLTFPPTSNCPPPVSTPRAPRRACHFPSDVLVW